MQIVTRWLAPLALVLALVVPSGSARSSATVLAISTVDRRVAQLVELDRATLRATGRNVGAEGFAGAWSFSPDGSRLALANTYVPTLGRPAGLLFVDVKGVRAEKRLRIPGELGRIRALAWVSPTRLVALVSGSEREGMSVLGVDASSGRIVGRQTVEGRVLGGAATAGGLVLLAAPASGIGPARIVAVDRALGVRSAPLARIRAGWSQTGEGAELRTSHRTPGFALDSVGRRSFVVGADEPVAEVDLGTLAVSYRTLVRAPQGRAKSPSTGPYRQAVWLGEGMLAVTGWRWAGLDPKTRRFVQEPAGLRLVDTRTWAERSVDAETAGITLADSVLLAGSESGGLTAYARDGRPLYSVFDGLPVSVVGSVEQRVLVRVADEPLTRIVDVRTGRELGRRPGGLPVLLTTARSPID